MRRVSVTLKQVNRIASVLDDTDLAHLLRQLLKHLCSYRSRTDSVIAAFGDYAAGLLDEIENEGDAK